MIGIRKLGIVISAAAIGGAALAGALWAGTAHAQSNASISLTSAALGPSGGNNLVGSAEAVLTFSVTCPAHDLGFIDATTSQGGTGSGHTNAFACTGGAQSESVTASSTADYAAGQVYVGAALDIQPTGSSTGPYGLAAGTASIVAIQ